MTKIQIHNFVSRLTSKPLPLSLIKQSVLLVDHSQCVSAMSVCTYIHMYICMQIYIEIDGYYRLSYFKYLLRCCFFFFFFVVVLFKSLKFYQYFRFNICFGSVFLLLFYHLPITNCICACF